MLEARLGGTGFFILDTLVYLLSIVVNDLVDLAKLNGV